MANTPQSGDMSGVHEAFVSLSYSVKKNPMLADVTSHVPVLVQKNLAGVLLSIFKDGDKLRVELFNPIYGGAQFSCDVETLLERPINDGYLVEISWTQGKAHLNINNHKFGPIPFSYELNLGDVAPFIVASKDPDYANQDTNAVVYGEVIGVKESTYLVKFRQPGGNPESPEVEVAKESYAQLIYADKDSLEASKAKTED